nr:uncharacterized protein LOC109179766 [Ipomoea batatas]
MTNLPLAEHFQSGLFCQTLRTTSWGFIRAKDEGIASGCNRRKGWRSERAACHGRKILSRDLVKISLAGRSRLSAGWPDESEGRLGDQGSRLDGRTSRKKGWEIKAFRRDDWMSLREAFSFEAKVLTEVQVPSQRIMLYNDEGNEESLQIDKNFLEERRDAAYARMAEYQQAVKQYQDKRAKVKHLLVSYLVLRDQEANRPTEVGKLAIKWEGP